MKSLTLLFLLVALAVAQAGNAGRSEHLSSQSTDVVSRNPFGTALKAEYNNCFLLGGVVPFIAVFLLFGIGMPGGGINVVSLAIASLVSVVSTITCNNMK